MAIITLRSIKGSPLTIEETDANFSNLNTEVGTKLDATSYNAADILVKLKTVDTDTSGLNANFLQGLLPLSTNTASSIVSRDSSGNFSAGTITANLTGNTSGLHTGNVTGNLTGLADNSLALGGFAANLYLLASNAASTYLTQANASSTYLTQANASSTYLTQVNASSTYATITSNNLKAPIASPTLTGIPLAPTAVAGTNTTQIATTEFISTAISNHLSSDHANLAKSYILAKITSSTTYTAPSGVSGIYIFAWGATGGSSVQTVGGTAGGGVGGAGYAEKYIASPTGSYSIIIGARGDSSGTSGGTTSIIGSGVSISITGSGGVTGTGGSTGGIASGGTFNANGGNGGAASISTNSGAGGGGGAGSRAGNGYNGGNGVGGGSGVLGSTGGGGGTGGAGSSGSPPTAGAGGIAATSQSVSAITLPLSPVITSFEAGTSGGAGAGGVMTTGYAYIYPSDGNIGNGRANIGVGTTGVIYILHVFG